MMLPNTLAEKIDKWIATKTAFVIWRNPEDGVIRYISGNTSTISISELPDAKGFVFFPFSGDGILFTESEINTYVESDSNPLVINKQQYIQLCKTCIDEVASSSFEKLVLSRIKKVDHPDNFSISNYFIQLETAYPSAYVYLANIPNYGLWCGASPELLVKHKEKISTTMSLAGTRSNFDAVEWGEKEKHEQALVTKFIHSRFIECGYETIQISELESVSAGLVVHLRNRFQAEVNSVEAPLKLVQALHPTPAVCGLPKEKALAYILENEPQDRKLYSGFFGSIRSANDFDFRVNLRCMEITNNSLYLYLGGGITAQSNPELEWEETELKAQTLLNLLA